MVITCPYEKLLVWPRQSKHVRWCFVGGGFYVFLIELPVKELCQSQNHHSRSSLSHFWEGRHEFKFVGSWAQRLPKSLMKNRMTDEQDQTWPLWGWACMEWDGSCEVVTKWRANGGVDNIGPTHPTLSGYRVPNQGQAVHGMSSHGMFDPCVGG